MTDQQQQPVSLNYQQSSEKLNQRTYVGGPHVHKKRGTFHTPPLLPPPYYFRPGTLTAIHMSHHMNHSYESSSSTALEISEETVPTVNEAKNTLKFLIAFSIVLSIFLCLITYKSLHMP
ncbi:hypothetical protein HCN44_005222 [Aphidius gifuensis]|uniref:Uncharacterized protein n=1 Tax=Aphidius gifuensis TaxID=684658 RepID=A0A834XSY4_APHGI|nr:uncharacterized protein LOC122850975 [Aphidius gifuensis]KAF7992878.1 hypothetical protein HCN44_005222 [Aphidius gifuensis]